MTIDREKYLPYLNQFLHHSGFEIRSDGQMRCPNSGAHNNGDKNFSAKYYQNDNNGHPRVKCFGCGFDGDIYDIIGHVHRESNFLKQYEIIDNLYGSGKMRDVPAQKSEKKPAEKAVPVSVTLAESAEIYSPENIDRCRAFSGDDIVKTGIAAAMWAYTDAAGGIIAADVRFEKDVEGKKQKKVVTFWYNGKSLKFTGDVFLVFNLYNSLKSDKPILIHEGAKCATIGAASLPGLSNVAYNRGSDNAGKPDWSVYAGRPVFILQDNDIPGMKAAMKIKACLPHAIILKNIYSYFEIDDMKGADIEQLLEQSGADEIEKYILSYNEDEQSGFMKSKQPLCLGVDDNNRLFFIDRFQRLYDMKRDALNKQKLLTISPLEYWTETFGSDKGVINWDAAADEILEISSKKEFDSNKVRGRGAWREDENYIYHDGKNTHGIISGEYMYLRKNKRDIGINDPPAGFEIPQKIRELCSNISFAGDADIVKLLGWSFLSPFSGALKWRPALLLTGESGSGKTTILEKIVLPICGGKHYNTHQTSPAGIRADVGNDSCAICLEEAEAGNTNTGFDKNIHRNNLFGMMRASSSDDAPEGVKSNSEQQIVKYSMKNMFLFVSIAPTVADVADDNRIFKVNFIKPEKKNLNTRWEEVEKNLIALLTRENCRALRALTWKILPKIIDDAKMIIDIMKYQFKKSSRIATGESILVSAYLNMINRFEITQETAAKFLTLYYKEVGEIEERDEGDELLKKIFDEIVEVEVSRVRKKISIRECIDSLFHNDFSVFETENLHAAEKEIRRILGHYGIAYQKDRTLALSNNNDKIKKILGKEEGYAKLFQRHRLFMAQPDGRPDKVVNINKQAQRATIIEIYRGEPEPEVELNIPF